MSTLVSAVGARLRTLVHDLDKVRWTDAELIDWINDGMAALVRLAPHAYSQRVVRALSAGSHQSLESLGITDGHAILDVACNVSAAGDYGRPIRRVEREVMDSAMWSWRTDTADEVAHWAADPATPKEFFVHPVPPSGSRVELVYAAVPPSVSALTSTIPLDDIYIAPLGHYVAFRMYSKDIEAAANAAAAANYYTLFTQSLGVKA